MTKTIKKQSKSKTVVEKIRQFREDFYNDYMKRHKNFDIHQFTTEFLNRPISKTA